MIEIGRKIAGKRQEMGITQAALAHKIGLSQSDISEIENGTKSPTWCNIEKIAKELKVGVSEILPLPNVQINNNNITTSENGNSNIGQYINFNINIHPKNAKELQDDLDVILKKINP